MHLRISHVAAALQRTVLPSHLITNACNVWPVDGLTTSSESTRQWHPSVVYCTGVATLGWSYIPLHVHDALSSTYAMLR